MKSLSISAAALVVCVFCGALNAQVSQLDSSALALLMQRNVTVVDIRREDEWRQTGVLPDSHLLTFFDAEGNYDAARWLAHLSDLAQPNDEVILICASGQRSELVSRFLHEQGYSSVYNVTDGISAWTAQGGTLQPHN